MPEIAGISSVDDVQNIPKPELSGQSLEVRAYSALNH